MQLKTQVQVNNFSVSVCAILCLIWLKKSFFWRQCRLIASRNVDFFHHHEVSLKQKNNYFIYKEIKIVCA